MGNSNFMESLNSSVLGWPALLAQSQDNTLQNNVSCQGRPRHGTKQPLCSFSFMHATEAEKTSYTYIEVSRHDNT
jgi:hypothetical protein